MAIFAGLSGFAAGLAGAVPGLALARRARKGGHPSVAAGLATILGSLGALTLLIGVAYRALGGAWTVFAAAAIAIYLVLWWIEAFLAWRWMRPFGQRR